MKITSTVNSPTRNRNAIMARIEWENGPLEVTRIVVDELTPHWMRSTLQGLALNLGLKFASPNVRPGPGDLWVGRAPDNGWGDSFARIGWARGEEVYQAIAQLRRADPIYATEAEFDAPHRA
jgi:hypothetical protein